MVRDLIVLPEGTEIFSGSGTPAIQSVSLTRCVNSGKELTLGSVCPAMAEIRMIAPKGELQIAAGTEFALYRVDDRGNRQKTGIFLAEKPVQAGENTYCITAYDRVAKLEKDLSGWLETLEGWPYPVLEFAGMVAQACGLSLKNTTLLNGDYRIQRFSARGITGRKLMAWLGQVCAGFCRATPEGELEFAWYTNRYAVTVAPTGFVRAGAGWEVGYDSGDVAITSPAVAASHDAEGNVTVTGLVVVADDAQGNLTLGIDDGSRTGLGYCSGGLSYEDYTVAPIERVHLRLTEDDLGTAYPQAAGEANTYTITGNYLLTNRDTEALQAVAEGIYNAICHVRYTPCKVALPANSRLDAGDVVQITDPNGHSITAYIMTKTRKGQRDTLECTGSPRRDSADAVNEENFTSVSGKVFELRKTVDGLKMQILQQESETGQRLAKAELDAAGLATRVGSMEAETAQNAHEIASVKESVTEMKQTAEGVTVQVQSILDNGVSKVTTGMGYTFDAYGLKIQKPGEAVGNLLDNTGMYVTRSGQVILQANASGVVATDVKVNNFLILGEHARLEDYSDGEDARRTACFWV